ncbi:hypothetical protein [Acinetobacter sp. ANC 5414]|uniref:hypothetical protein n=1 Tax=Acinetobacter sp. ANC 5414 TaxID=2731251 RepID=UPI00148F9DC3|nr:hypothetical protein [Acinetobacter sp. ANC 5414]NNH00624.1 hypothetical protein [Acinetobacter sp. ANC 5414]
MNKMTQAALAALVLGACSTAVMAGEEGRPNQDRGCNTGSCTGSIPIVVKVPKRCMLKIDTPSIALGDGETETGRFSVGANANYNLLVDTVNRVGTSATTRSEAKSGSNAVGITVETRLAGSSHLIKLNEQKNDITPGRGGWNSYNVSVKSDYVGISKPAGNYSDKLNITVTL